MICSNCSSQNTDNVVTCIYCGSELENHIQDNGEEHGKDINNQQEFRVEPHRAGKLKVGKCIAEGWNLYKLDVLAYTAYALILFCVFWVVMQIPIIGSNTSDLLSLFLALLAIIVAVPLYTGFYTFALESAKGYEPEFANFLDGINHIIQLTLVGVVKCIIILIGWVIFVYILAVSFITTLSAQSWTMFMVGTIFASLLFISLITLLSFPELLVVDKEKKVFDAIWSSVRMVFKNFISMHLLAFVNILISGIAIFIGFFLIRPFESWTHKFMDFSEIFSLVLLSICFPFQMCIMVSAYKKLFGFNEE